MLRLCPKCHGTGKKVRTELVRDESLPNGVQYAEHVLCYESCDYPGCMRGMVHCDEKALSEQPVGGS